MKLARLEAEILALPTNKRAALAQKLLTSLEDIPEPEFDRLWGEESARRAAEIDSGKAKPIPGTEVAKKARKLLR
jgi:putative addiction module component (TIGR02574 family)